jgi:hypothetical protein
LIEIISLVRMILKWTFICKIGLSGTNGQDGKDGRDGQDGAPGPPGIRDIGFFIIV